MVVIAVFHDWPSTDSLPRYWPLNLFNCQVLDYFVADLNHGKSCALMFFPSLEAFCHTSSTDVTPFGTNKIVLSLGMGIVAVLSIPLGYWNLEDNVVVQNVAMFVIILSWHSQLFQHCPFFHIFSILF